MYSVYRYWQVKAQLRKGNAWLLFPGAYTWFLQQQNIVAQNVAKTTMQQEFRKVKLSDSAPISPA